MANMDATIFCLLLLVPIACFVPPDAHFGYFQGHLWEPVKEKVGQIWWLLTLL